MNGLRCGSSGRYLLACISGHMGSFGHLIDSDSAIGKHCTSSTASHSSIYSMILSPRLPRLVKAFRHGSGVPSSADSSGRCGELQQQRNARQPERRSARESTTRRAISRRRFGIARFGDTSAGVVQRQNISFPS